jgi:Leucine-rich repeat (LRR) protein
MAVDLKNRGLTEIPWSEIPTDVTRLDLSYNQLTRLRRPLEIGRLTQLTYLDLSFNQLTRLRRPPEIGQLKQLIILDLGNN